MPTPIPTGQVVETPDGLNLLLTRTFSGTVREVWAFVTEPELTAKWIGRWEGQGTSGETIKMQMGFEESAPWFDVKITGCAAPNLVKVKTVADEGSWELSIELKGSGNQTELVMTHHGVALAEVGSIGPGWEYYLDQLVASFTDTPMPNWDDYFPAQQEYFNDLVR